MKISKSKAGRVFGRLFEAFSRREYPFDQPGVIVPQVPENLPKNLRLGTREHGLYLFATCYWMRGGIESTTAFRSLSRVYNAHPDWFLPENWQKLDPATLAANFRSVGLGFNADQIAAFWVSNLRRLAEDWDSNPANLFVDIETYEEALDRIQNRGGKTGFRGFQEKMVSMITYFLMDAGLVDRWHFPLPVDFHILRTIFAHEIIVAEPGEANGNGFYTKSILAGVRKLCHDYCVTHGIDPLRLCDALWLYSQWMCAKHPGNQSRVGKRDGRKTEVRPIARWTVAQTRAFERTCGVCSVARTCRWCVPSAEYYIRGKIVLREERDTPPQASLFNIL